MHPSYVRKTKALVWYWLNHHPAEVYRSSTEVEEFGFIEDNLPFDMLVESQNGWKIGESVSERYFFDMDADRWHDINKAVTAWCKSLLPGDLKHVTGYLKVVKGRPLNRWKNEYTGLKAPDWSGLTEEFMVMGLLDFNTDGV